MTDGGGMTETASAARRRVAVEMITKHESALRRTARRYSICAADADDAYQRALEILLVKAPPGEARELVRWMQTVTKHEALAIRRSRERQVSPPPPAGAPHEDPGDWLSLIPARADGPAERAERREDIARSREALKTLKPAELKALTLLAEGYSYAEIGEMTGYSQTKVNRCLAEGRERFRAFLSRSESGARCEELRPLLSAFCDGEASSDQAAAVREHLRVCGGCRAAMRAYRAAPRAVAALLPAPVLARSLLERAHDTVTGLQARLAGRGGGSAVEAAGQAAGGGVGSAALAKGLAICAGTVGGAAACVAAGVVPAPPVPAAGGTARPHLERVATAARTAGAERIATAPRAKPAADQEPAPLPEPTEVEPAPAEPRPEPVETAPVETAPVEAATAVPAAPSPDPATAPQPGSPAGEFGP